MKIKARMMSRERGKANHLSSIKGSCDCFEELAFLQINFEMVAKIIFT